MKAYFELQFNLLNRRLSDEGIKPWLVYSLLPIVFTGLSVYLFRKVEFAEYIYLLIALVFIIQLSETNKIEFLQVCYGDKIQKRISITENLISAFPFLLFLLLQQRWFSSLLLLTTAVVLGTVKFRTKVNFTAWTPFGKQPFEFTTGFRNYYYLFLAAYALTVIAVSERNFNLGLVVLLLSFAIMLNFYTKPENDYFVWVYHLNSQEFLFFKIKTALLYSTMLVLPIFLMMLAYFPQNSIILLLAVIIGWAFLTFMIVSKYAAYPSKINITQGILLAFCLWFPPLLVIFIPYFFLKSKKRISRLLP